MTTEKRVTKLISPCGNALVDLLAPAAEVPQLLRHANSLHRVLLTERSLCDLELLATGAFSPLDQFMGQADYQRVLQEMRLSSGQLFSIPITLPLEPDPKILEGREIALCDAKNEVLAVMTIAELYEWDRDEAAQRIFGTKDLRHPLVTELSRWGRLNASGSLRVIRLPRYFDFVNLRLTPSQVRERLRALGRSNVVAFQTRNPMHRVHEEMTRQAMEKTSASLLLHPVVGMTKPGDIDRYNRVRTYKVMTEKYLGSNRVVLSLLPLAMRMAGPREVLWHALIRRNYGANFMIVGRDYAGPGYDSDGKSFYPPYAAQEILQQYGEELGVAAVPFEEMVYVPDHQRYVEVSQVPPATRTLSISGTELRSEYVEKGVRLPEWFSRPEVAEILQTAGETSARGACIWFTGFSCAGKSTIAESLTSLILERGRRVTLLDGDVVRTNLSKGLGFSKADRDINIRRIGFVAAEIVHHAGLVICAAISPYRAVRNEVRNMMPANSFVEVFVDAPIEVCMQRDTKGMYARALRGEIENFTGVDDPYESPLHAELTLDSAGQTPEHNAHIVLEYLTSRGFVAQPVDSVAAYPADHSN